MIRHVFKENNNDLKLGRRTFVFSSVLAIGNGLKSSKIPVVESIDTKLPADMMDLLRRAGVPTAAQEIGIDFDRVFAPLQSETHHPYRRYRWSVSFSASGGPVIQALPPEEEMGWIPWEEWFSLNGKPMRRAMVLYPVKKMTRNVPLWWIMEQSQTELVPRRSLVANNLGDLFLRDRIFEAAWVVGFDAKKLILDPLSPMAREIYLRMNWSIAPHRLAADLPVIQCLPPLEHLGQWPWETWYTDGKTPLIHHVHYSKSIGRTGHRPWREQEGVPQRPYELLSLDWYWYNDESMTPALAGIGN